jgi:hypothetical protein
MEKLSSNTIIYSLNIEDVQTVAFEEIGRELSENEIKKITEPLAESIDWYNAIASTISKTINV